MKLNYREFGEGEPLIFLHGMLGMSDNWITVSKSFVSKYKIYIPDLRNHGFSPHSDIHNFEVMSKDIFSFFEELNIKKAVLIGHSMGGKVALNFARKYPDKVQKLIIIDISPRKYSFDQFINRGIINHHELLEFMNTVNFSEFSNRQELKETISSEFMNEFITQLLLKNIKKESNNAFNWKPNVKTLRNNLYELTDEVKLNKNDFNIETLFLFGSKSPYFTQDDFFLIKEKIPDSKIKVIKDAGHAIHIDKPNELIKEIDLFLLNQSN